MARPEYITFTELNTLLNLTGADAYPDDAATTLLINEASEYLEYDSTGLILNTSFIDLTVDNFRTRNTKIGLAYQVRYIDTLIDDEDYSSSSGASLGKFKESSGKTSVSGEGLKLSPKARRYWQLAGLRYRGTA